MERKPPPAQRAMSSKSMAERFAAVRHKQEEYQATPRRQASLGFENTTFEVGKHKNKTFLSVYYADPGYVKWTIEHKATTGDTANWDQWYEFIEHKISAYEGKASRASSSETTDSTTLQRIERLERSVDRLERSVEDLQDLVQDLCKIIRAPNHT